MVISREDLTKIRRFVNYWLEKIEIEVVDEEDLEYPKYLLRSTMCNILSEMGEYANCLRLANFNIKEITSDIRQQKNGTKEKARILVLSVLYKVDAMVALKDTPGSSIRELVKKAEGIVEKFDLKSENNLIETIKKKNKLIAKYEQNEESENGSSYQRYFPGKPMPHKPLMSGSNSSQKRSQSTQRPKSAAKSFLIKSRPESPQNRRKSPEVNVRLSANQDTNKIFSKQFEQGRDRGSPKNNFFVKKPVASKEQALVFESMGPDGMALSSKQRPESVKQATTSGPHPISAAQQARREFSEGLDGLLKLGDFVKKEIKGLQTEFETPKQPKQTTAHIFDSSESGEKEKFDDPIESEISKKMEFVLKSQLEWEKERKMLQEKLDKLEKTLEKQQSNEETASHLKQTPKSMLSPPNQLKSPPNNTARSPFLQLPEPGTRNGIKYKSSLPTTPTDRRPSLYSSNDKSEMSVTSRVVEAAVEGYNASLKIALKQLSKGEIDTPLIKQLIVGQDGEIYRLVFEILKSTNLGEEPTINMVVVSPTSPDIKSPLAKDILTFDNLRFLFQQIYFSEVVPSNIPATCFQRIGMFLQTILSKFVRVKNTAEGHQLTIERTPKSLVELSKPCKFLGHDHTAALIHLYDCTFRLIVRKQSAKREHEHEGITAEVLFNDFVINQFFEVNTDSEYNDIVTKLAEGQKLGSAELETIKQGSTPSRTTLSLINTPEKQVDLPLRLEKDDADTGAFSQVH